jgi:hypothetical protein
LEEVSVKEEEIEFVKVTPVDKVFKVFVSEVPSSEIN